MDIDSHPFELSAILPLCWRLLLRGTQDRRFGFHHPVVATVDTAGRPKCRVVILRDADAFSNTLCFNADIRTNKWDELSAQPAISLAFYDEQEKTHLRVEGTAVLHTQDDIARISWHNSQRMSRLGYCSTPGPGTEISDHRQFHLPGPEDDSSAGFANFGTIEVRVQNIEWLYLKVRGNRRATFNLVTGASRWLVP